MVKLSANLGFLWTEHPLTTAIRAAAAAGFDAVECHTPYDVEAEVVAAALRESALPMISINTRPGNAAQGERGLAAVSGRQSEARAHIDEAIAYAGAIGASHVHVMAGVASGPDARTTFVENLGYAAPLAAADGLGIVIEPINQRDIPDYFLSYIETAAAVIDEVGARNVRIMFDCYHVQISQGDLLRRFEAHLPMIGHVQFAAVPSRSEPDQGELDYPWLLSQFESAGYRGYVGAECRPTGDTESSLGWLKSLR